MKHTLRRFVIAITLFLGMGVAFTSCDVDNWYPAGPDDSGSSFWDSRLTGYWQLIEISPAQGGLDTNYMFFNGSGRGIYYYYLNGRPYKDLFNYWCQDSVNGQSWYQCNIQYQSSSTPSTMNYWFQNGFLYFQWRNQSGYTTSVYKRVVSFPAN